MELTPKEAADLKVAGELIDAGIPVFAAAPNPDRPGEYYLPTGWQQTTPDRATLERWRPGWALGAVGGHVADFLDFDPRNGGSESKRELEIQGQVPRAFGVQSTPSGGTHLIISPTGERKSTGFMPGVDLQSGNGDGIGRGFVYIAPTIRPSKAPETLGQLHAYEWVQAPDLDYLAEFAPGTDDTLDGVLARVAAHRSKEGAREATPAEPRGGSQLFGGGPAFVTRDFTQVEAEAFCQPHLDALEHAQIGEIEENANRAAAALSHFVPSHFTADLAFRVLEISLSKTAYDPSHPASGWTVEKFRPVIDGRRPPLDGWKARRTVSAAEAAAAFGAAGQAPMALPATQEEAQDAIDELLGKMLTADQMVLKPPPEPLVWDLLDRDTIAALIGMPGSFKSFVALDLAGHVGRGLPWHGRRVHQGEVVYIAAEGARGMTLRIRAWQAKHGQMTGVRFLPEPVQVNDPVAWQVLIEACRRIQPVMVVIDTQAMVTSGMEENSNREMSQVYVAFRAIREASKACVLVVHHTTKAGDSTRGAGSQDGAQDTRLKLERASRENMSVSLKDEKQKDMAETGGRGIPLVLEHVPLGRDEATERDLSSLVVAAEGEFTRVAGRNDIPEAWETGHGEAQVRLIKVLRDQGGTIGLTRSEAKASLVERFYDANPKKLARSTFATAWTKVLEKCNSEGSAVVVNVGGERYAVDSVALEGMINTDD